VCPCIPALQLPRASYVMIVPSLYWPQFQVGDITPFGLVMCDLLIRRLLTTTLQPTCNEPRRPKPGIVSPVWLLSFAKPQLPRPRGEDHCVCCVMCRARTLTIATSARFSPSYATARSGSVVSAAVRRPSGQTSVKTAEVVSYCRIVIGTTGVSPVTGSLVVLDPSCYSELPQDA